MLNLFKGGIKGRLDLAGLRDRLFLTIRRMGGNNSAGGGRGEKKMKKGIVLVTMLLGVLVLVGWGCGQKSAAPADTNSDTNEVSETSSDSTSEATSDTTGEVPAGWTEYENERYGFSFQYPEGWDLRVVRSTPFGWSENNYELEEIQLREVSSGDYIGAFSFAIVSNPSHRSIRDWLTSNNRTAEALELRDKTVGTLVGIELHNLTTEVRSPDDRAFPGVFAFSDPEANYIFFPELGQEHEIFQDYGTTADEFENQVLSTLTFGR